VIEFDHVTRSYGSKVAVDNLSLEVRPGEVFAYLGPNGAGKTTSIKMLVGLLRPTRGTVRVCGHDVVSETRLSNRVLAYVPDEPHLYDKLTGREFLQFIADIYGLGPDETDERIARVIAQFELSEFVDELTEKFSHGMKQRTVFAAAFLHDPKVLVVDEPMVGLDPRSIRLIKDLLSERAASGATVFMSTHTLSIAEEIADRIGVIHQGKLLFLGSLEELQQQMSDSGTSLEALYLALTDPPSASASAAQLSADAKRGQSFPKGDDER